MDDGGDEPVPDDARVVDYEELLAGAPEPADPVAVDERDAASLCYTSGTTGRPKGVLYSHRSIVLHALLLLGVDGFAISERDVVMPIVPMFHVNAWGLPYAAMLAGADLVLPGPRMEPAAAGGPAVPPPGDLHGGRRPRSGAAWSPSSTGSTSPRCGWW